jgi:diguanylate cyclase (GGDEF)-like protein/PAS domain S-box-containing protein
MNKELPAPLFARVLDESIDAALIIDQNSTIRYLNASMQVLAGYAPGELLGQPLDVLLPEGLAEKHRGYVLDYIRRGTVSSVLGRVREFAIRHRTGAMIPIELKAVDLGADEGVHFFGAFLVDIRARRAQERRTTALLAQLAQQAMTDPLTALPNRRAYDAEVDKVAARGRRNDTAASVGVADIDHFKQINDQYGHPVGDQLLREVGWAIERAARGTDFVARTGGEEFGMLFPDTSIATARQVAERIRKAVAESCITTPTGKCIHVTISIGLAALAPGTAPDLAQSSADAALYLAKEKGRDRIETA